jgi:hypothetical protein
MIGKLTAQLVVTGSERRGRPKAIQPGNRERVISIAAINAASCYWGSNAKSKTCKSGAGTTLDYRRESASDARCMHAFSGQGARLQEWEVSGADTTAHHILGLTPRLILGLGLTPRLIY